MTKKTINKKIKLGLEFDRYISKNPSVLKKVPKGSSIVVTSKKDCVHRNAASGKFVVARKTGRKWFIEKPA